MSTFATGDGLPSHVVGIDRSPAFAPFDPRAMGDSVCLVIGAYVQQFGDGSTVPCFVVQTPDGQHVDIAMVSTRKIGPTERGELERSGVAIAE